MGHTAAIAGIITMLAGPLPVDPPSPATPPALPPPVYYAAPAPPPPPLVPAPPVKLSPENEAMRDARKIMGRQPEFDRGPRPVLPAEELAQGHHGSVWVFGVIGTDGRMTGAKVYRSSKADSLDHFAVAQATATKFYPGRDRAGQKMAVPIVFPLEYAAYSEDGDLRPYTCEQMLRDFAWWRSVNPGSPDQNHPAYRLVAWRTKLPGDGTPVVVSDPAARTALFDTMWQKAVATCRADPTLMFTDLLVASR